MGRVARGGVVCLMLLAVGLARLIEVQLDVGPPATPELRMAGPSATPPEPATPGATREARSVPAGAPAPTAPAPAPTPPTASAGRTYRVQAGDTLGSIARKVYGTSRGWERILEANKTVISSPTKIRAGIELQIPPAPTEGKKAERRIPGTRGA